jgi:hypothetical protein
MSCTTSTAAGLSGAPRDREPSRDALGERLGDGGHEWAWRPTPTSTGRVWSAGLAMRNSDGELTTSLSTFCMYVMHNVDRVAQLTRQARQTHATGVRTRIIHRRRDRSRHRRQAPAAPRRLPTLPR